MLDHISVEASITTFLIDIYLLGGPYCCSITEFNNVESNMRKRRKEIQEVMTDSNEAVFSMSTFPRLGCEGKMGYQIYMS